uniref:Uncharacterized protein n=1 Tax=Candidatus Phytoplasma australasiaticum subsp. australasiaticum TaxID=2832407 RepID=A0A7S7FZL2_9MOLU|nr:hypothetical protein H7685_01115 ['Parthenium hysterophorus' phyllody phytoplasma]
MANIKYVKKIEPQIIANIKILYGGVNKQKYLTNLKTTTPLLITTLNKLNEYVINQKLLKIHKISF